MHDDRANLFEMGADGVLVQLLEHVPADREEAVRDAIACWPTGAIFELST